MKQSRGLYFICLMIILFSSSNKPSCETILQAENMNARYFSPHWELAEIAYNAPVDPLGKGLLWKEVTLPVRLTSPNMHGEMLFLLRKGFTLPEELRDSHIGLYTGLTKYSFECYVNGVRVGRVGSSSRNDYPGGIWETFGDFSIPSDIIHFNARNILILKFDWNYRSVKFPSMFVSSMETVREAFFLDHFRFKIIHFLAGIVSLLIAFPFLYLYMKNRREPYYFYLFLGCVVYGGYGILISFDIPPIEFSLYFGLQMLMLSLSLTLIILAIDSYYARPNPKRALFRHVVLCISIIAASVYFFLQDNLLKAEYHAYHYSFVYLPQLVYAFVLIVYNLMRRRVSFQPVFVGIGVLLVACMIDFVTDTFSLNPFIWFSPFGVLFFCLAFFFQLANRYINDTRIAERNAAMIKYADVLLDEKERLAVTLGSIGDAVICTDKKGIITLFNKAAAEVHGLRQRVSRCAGPCRK